MATANAVEIGRRPRTSWNGEALYEIVDDKKVEVYVGVRELGIATRLAVLISAALGPAPTGEPFIEMIFRLKKGSRKARRPDLAFVAYDRWPDRKLPDDEAWEIVPNLLVEIISKNNSAEEVQTKLKEYFEAGVQVVWVIYPRQEQILVYTGIKEVAVLDQDDTLRGGPVLPTFSVSVKELLA
ncbi:MAG: Uma2 family endonuclease [Gemmataceae bacterium]|nr:Uma2 family endonuclease [Gemmataceae bacterium]